MRNETKTEDPSMKSIPQTEVLYTLIIEYIYTDPDPNAKKMKFMKSARPMEIFNDAFIAEEKGIHFTMRDGKREGVTVTRERLYISQEEFNKITKKFGFDGPGVDKFLESNNAHKELEENIAAFKASLFGRSLPIAFNTKILAFTVPTVPIITEEEEVAANLETPSP